VPARELQRRIEGARDAAALCSGAERIERRVNVDQARIAGGRSALMSIIAVNAARVA
jgi:hypothetical protein